MFKQLRYMRLPEPLGGPVVHFVVVIPIFWLYQMTTFIVLMTNVINNRKCCLFKIALYDTVKLFKILYILQKGKRKNAGEIN